MKQNIFEIKINKNPFFIKIIRKETKEILFETSSKTFVFSQYFLQFSTQLPTQNYFGWGSRHAFFDLKNGTYTI